MVEDKIKKEEEKHLNDVVALVSNASVTLDKSLKSIGKDNLEKLKDLREDPETGTDFEIFLMNLQEKNRQFNFKDKFLRLEELNFLKKEPYFARIDLKDTNGKSGLNEDKQGKIYIGKFGYTEDRPVVTDWRAKIASVYYRYRYPQKNVSYETPEGKVTRDLTLKRTYEIEDSQLVKYYNNDIQLDEKDIVIEKMNKRTGGVLEDIVETIQESQLDIIEEDPREVCIVQGCVGSGKSTVAIHKLAHIFFNFPNLIHPERSILVAKNQILVGYLSTLFPKLGIFNINYKTLRELLIHIIFREGLKLQVDFDVENDTSKFDLQEIKKLKAAVSTVHDKYAGFIEKMCNNPEYQSFVNYKYSDNLSPMENLSEIYVDVEEEFISERDHIKENPNAPNSWLLKENIKVLRRILKQIQDWQEDLLKKDFQKIVNSYNSGNKLSYTATLIYIYLYSQLIGYSKFLLFEYCVIDEGQDFSLLEYLVLGTMTLRGRMSIFGDLNQSLEADGITNWNDITKVIKDAKNAKTFKLEINYRSTKPIIDLATKVLNKFTNNYLPKSINRVGNEPEISVFTNNDEMLKKFKVDISKDIKKIEKSIGVICFGDDIYKQAENTLDLLNLKENLIKLDSRTKIHYIPKGVYLMRSEDCKGLEFSKVFILNVDLNKKRSFSEARHVFVALTRAMNELLIYGVKD